MKNYLARLGLKRKAPQRDVTDAIADAMAGTADAQTVRDAETVLSVKVTRAYYERVHLQYDAIHAALPCLKEPGAVDSHHWMERLVEFDQEAAERAG